MLTKYFSLIRNNLNNKSRNVFVISQLTNALLGILIGKLTAVYFLPETFGKFNLQFATYTFFFSLFLNPFLQFLKNITNKNLEKDGHLYILRILLILLTICITSLILIFKIKFQSDNIVLLSVVITLFVNVIYNILTDYFNVKGILDFFSWSTILKSIFTIFFLLLASKYFLHDNNALLILWLMQIVGFLFGVIFFIGKYKIYLIKNLDYDFKIFLKNFFKYTFPLFVLAFWGWINSYFDRFIIEYYLEARDVGIYNANLGLGSKIFIMFNPIFLALITPVVFSKDYHKNDKKSTINRYVLAYSFVSLFILVFLYFAKDYIGDILLSKMYKEGFYLIFWTAVAYFIITVTYLYESLFYFENKTQIILYSNIVAAIINILLNFMLIYKFGLTGAVISLIVASLSRFIFTIFFFTKS